MQICLLRPLTCIEFGSLRQRWSVLGCLIIVLTPDDIVKNLFVIQNSWTWDFHIVNENPVGECWRLYLHVAINDWFREYCDVTRSDGDLFYVNNFVFSPYESPLACKDVNLCLLCE